LSRFLHLLLSIPWPSYRSTLTPLQYPPKSFCNMTNSLLRWLFVPRHCTSAVNKITIRWLLTCFLSALYRDTRISQKVCTMMPKTAPCFVHSSWYQDSTPMTLPAPACIHSATQTPFIAGPLAFIFSYFHKMTSLTTTNIGKSIKEQRTLTPSYLILE
jgi:hypothetical protein